MSCLRWAVPAQARPIYAGRAGGPTGRNLRPGPGPPSDRASPVHIISCRAVLWALIFGPFSCWPEKHGLDSQHYLRAQQFGETGMRLRKRATKWNSGHLGSARETDQCMSGLCTGWADFAIFFFFFSIFYFYFRFSNSNLICNFKHKKYINQRTNMTQV
jgi:hypothetical protein